MTVIDAALTILLIISTVASWFLLTRSGASRFAGLIARHRPENRANLTIILIRPGMAVDTDRGTVNIKIVVSTAFGMNENIIAFHEKHASHEF